MAVETRYVVVRNGKEVMSTTNKKAADEYDKMLDAANALFEVIGQSGIEMSDDDRDELSVFLAKNKDNVLVALGAKKAKKEKKQPATSAPFLEPRSEVQPLKEPANETSPVPEDEKLDILGDNDNQEHLITVPAGNGIELDLSEAMESGDGLLDSAKGSSEQTA
ncbi:TPA: YebG family protein [Vibrio parahaemolyticus]|uniref:YebG family protein n=1 Tax=Vibrio campbellii TaxID=680 RepID=UPI001F07EAD0|nr:YebG family protein [Vibrio campbellii]UMM06660.1 YebG family protein [Vibrio campbellii]